MDRSMKACLGVILVGAVVLLVWRFQADKYNVSKPYHNDEFGFSILYPESWEPIKTGAEGSETSKIRRLKEPSTTKASEPESLTCRASSRRR